MLVTAQKFLGIKISGKKSWYFALKSPFIKKSSEIKSYLDSRLCFLGIFSDSMPVRFYTKTSPGKKSYDIRKRMGTKDVYKNTKKKNNWY